MTEDALRLRGVSCRFGGLAALSDIDLDVGRGARFGIIGPNGAGKTTLFNVISGEVRSRSGQIQLFGRDVTRLRASSRVRAGLGRTYQVPHTFNNLSVRENLTLAVHGLRRSRLAPLRSWRRYRAQQDAVVELARRVGLEQRLDAVCGELSHGEIRQLEISLALALEPDLLLLDEPGAGLSPAERTDMRGLLRTLPDDMTLVMIEHDMEMLHDVVAEAAVLHQGRLIAHDTVEAISENETVRDIYLGSEL